MLRFAGAVLLMVGCIGSGWSAKERLKRNLDDLYRIRQIFQMFQSEIIYSRAPIPEACLRIGGRAGEPYRSALLSIKEEMTADYGESFLDIWNRQIKICMRKLSVSGEDKRLFLDFGSCIGYTDEKMQTQAVEQYIHKLDISIGRMEKDMADKCKVIMSLSIAGGLTLAIILL